MDGTYRYRAFISYSHKDKAFASWLQRKIERYIVPRALQQKYPHLPKDLKRSIFRDDDELSGGGALTPALKDALKASQKLIVICSEAAANSSWVDKEIRFFKEMHKNGHIIPLIKEGEVQTVCPKALKEGGFEPLAVDVSQGRQKALVKVIAALLDVPFAELWAREKRERRKRAAVWGVMAAFVLILGVYTYVQYSAIASNNQLAEIDKEISHIEYRLRHNPPSEDGVYRLGERLKVLKDAKRAKAETLKWFGLLHTPVSKRAKALYDKEGVDAALALLESSNSAAEDAVYARKNMLRAKLYAEKHDYAEAMRFYEKAVAVDESYENMYDYALFLMQEHQMKRAAALLEKLKGYDLEPAQRANVLNRLGIAYRNLKCYDEAKTAYAEALKLRKELARKEPDRYTLDLAWTYNNLGVLYKQLDLPSEAEKMHFKAFALRRDLAKREPEKYTFYVTCSMHNLGELYSTLKENEKAGHYFEEAIKIRRDMLARDPKRNIPALATSLQNLADLYAKSGKPARARPLYEEALRYREILAKENPQAYESALKETQKALAALSAGEK